MKNCKTALAVAIILLLSIIAYQQNQIIQLQQSTNTEKTIKEYLTARYGVKSIDDLIQKKLKEYLGRYTGNPFTTALYPGQFQAENITGMHWYTWLSGTLYNRTDTLAFPEQSATFIIFGKDTDGDGVCDVIYAKNCTSGQIEFGGPWDAGGVDGSNASAVIQVAINTLIYGGKVIIKNGLYLISSPIEIRADNVYIEGETAGYGNTPGARLKAATTINAIIVYNPDSNVNYRKIHLKNLWIEGDNKATYGVKIIGAIKSQFENLKIRTCTYGLAIYATAKSTFVNVKCEYNDYGLYIGYDSTLGHFSYENLFLRCTFIANNEYGIYSNPSSVHHLMTKFDTCTIEDNKKWGVYLRNVQWIVFENCHFEANNADGVADVDDLHIETSEHVIIIGGRFIGTDTRYSIYIGTPTGAVDGVYLFGVRAHQNEVCLDGVYRCIIGGYIFNNLTLNRVRDTHIISIYIYSTLTINVDSQYITFENCFLGDATINNSGTNIEFQNCRGFITENNGIATGLADGSYITHGLAGTPTTVTLTCLNSTYDDVPVIVSWNRASTNSTHIAVHIYWSNGTAITDPVIAVSWHAKYQP